MKSGAAGSSLSANDPYRLPTYGPNDLGCVIAAMDYTMLKVSPEAGAVVNGVNVSRGSAAALLPTMSVTCPLSAAVVVSLSNTRFLPRH